MLLEVDKLIPYARNARKHSDEQVSQIAASIAEFGFKVPIIVDQDLTVRAGHGRLMAAKKLGMVAVPVLQYSDLTDLQWRAFVLADNQIALNATWDEEVKKIEIEDLLSHDFDVKQIGFEPADFSSPDFLPGSEEDQGKLDEKKKATCPECGHEFTP